MRAFTGIQGLNQAQYEHDREQLLLLSGVKKSSVTANKRCWCLLMWKYGPHNGMTLIKADKIPTITTTQWHHMAEATNRQR